MLRPAPETDPGEVSSFSSTAQREGERTYAESGTCKPRHRMPGMQKPAEENHELLQHEI